MKKKDNDTKIIVGILIAVLIILLSVTGNLKFSLALVGYESVYKANYGHICCEEGAYEPKFIRYCDDVSIYKCNAYTDECRIEIHPAQDLGFNGRSVYYQICNLDERGCTTENRISFSGYSETTDNKLLYVPYGKLIKFSPLGFPNSADWGYIKYEADYRRFYIQGEENGRVYTQSTCILNSELKKRVLAGGLNELSKTGDNRCQNYITDYILVETKTYNYNGKEVICQTRNLYDIDTITLLDSSTKKIQGDKIKSVDCCPAEANCDADTFKFKEVVIKECTYDYECANAGEPVAITGTSYVTFDCENSKCVQSSPVQVECTNNAICVNKYNSPNYVCKNFKCSSDGSWLGHCGDGFCEDVIGETATSCPEDCGEYPRVPVCENCDKFVLNQIFGSFIKKANCKPATLQSNSLCFLSYVKYSICVLILIFGTIAGTNFFSESKKFQIENKFISFLISLTISLLLSLLIFALFWIGMIALIVLIIIKLVVK